MKKFTSFLEKLLVPMANSLRKIKPLSSISQGFTALIPITIIGSIFTLLSTLQLGPYQSIISAIKLDQVFAFAPKVTTSMISLYAVFLISKAMAEELELDDKVATIVGVLSLMSFLILIPLGVSGQTPDEVVVEIPSALATMYLGAPGLFTAIIVAISVPYIYNLFVKNNITLKMPKEVPAYISRSFAALIPAFAIAFIFGVVRLLFSLTTYNHVNEFIYTILRKPLASLTASPLTFIIFLLFCGLLWFFGMHGGLIVLPFLSMLYTPLALENLAATEIGAIIPHAITGSTWTEFAMLGGGGATLGLCLVMMFLSKSKRYKTLGKIALPAGICAINEPLVFGLPIVLNSILLIPYIITPVIGFLLTYFSTTIGLLPYPSGVTVPLGTPILISGFLSAGWRGALMQIVLVIVQVACYLPFFKVLDNQALVEEKRMIEEENENIATA